MSPEMPPIVLHITIAVDSVTSLTWGSVHVLVSSMHLHECKDSQDYTVQNKHSDTHHCHKPRGIIALLLSEPGKGIYQIIAVYNKESISGYGLLVYSVPFVHVFAVPEWYFLIVHVVPVINTSTRYNERFVFVCVLLLLLFFVRLFVLGKVMFATILPFTDRQRCMWKPKQPSLLPTSCLGAVNLRSVPHGQWN